MKQLLFKKQIKQSIIIIFLWEEPGGISFFFVELLGVGFLDFWGGVRVKDEISFF